ncbi:hypothetical protein BD780_003966 [Clostridium tetanomorphum]|uniref:hypothetical protein n=1 Tax=Clostridium tetanomorphum TaxID=1553 RepID=UPI000D908701|nr:hypothetical protein [Clostridium tetanomorphum]MBP1866113.1 hypothetical protein [Clostridium tetanomorphum]NRS86741.1 hypothetical protein [Clostridium tetanomorphum]NRZ99506.1 hypothetical protein [Clostridium tetanomorphum]SQC00470.1 membrane-associated protein [Clostridium tetanomorphum]
MKIIMVNKKRLGVSMIIIALMVLMFGIQKEFKDKMKLTTLMQSNINSLKEYKALDGEVKYKLPSEWNTEEKTFQGDEIIYHNDFQSKDFKIHGFVEVWNMDEDLEDFLRRSEQISKKQNIIKNYKMEKEKINNTEWYSINYLIEGPEKSNFRSSEYFKKYNNRLFRFSFFVREENFKENMPTIFKAIVQTLRYDKE